MYGLATVTALNFTLVKKCTSAPGICCLRQRIAGVVKTISPMEEKRMIRNFMNAGWLNRQKAKGKGGNKLSTEN